MPEKSKNNKGLIAGICVGVVVIIAIILAIVLLNRSPKLDDSYFVSDGAKYVLKMDPADNFLSVDTEEYSPTNMYLTYFYSGEKVTGLKLYFEFENEEVAKAALSYYEPQNDGSIEKFEVSGKYIIMTANADQYKDMTASDAKQQIELMEMLQDYDFEDEEYEDEYEEEGEEIITTDEEVEIEDEE